MGALALPVAALVSMFATAAPASAAFPSPTNTLAQGGSCSSHTTAPLDYVFCDDGVPSVSGTTPNVGGVSAVTVPGRYESGGNTFDGLPAKAPDAASVPGADPAGNVALDVDVSLPKTAPPAGGYPIMFMMHGCCSGDKTSWEADDFGSGENWHYNNAWYASRGYVVVNYTARGFNNGEANGNRGSTGQAQLDSRSYEINDFQSMACQFFANESDWNSATGNTVTINPNDVVVTGGSYGGGFSWMAMTDPHWTCNADTGASGTNMSLSTAAPKYGWTDLVYSLDPSGTQFQEPDRMPATNGCDSGPTKLDGSPCPDPQTPLGIPKTSINAALFGSGTTGVPPGAHTTFPQSIVQAFGCLNGPYPSVDPVCQSSQPALLNEFLNERSAYYQNQYFSRLASDPGTWAVPVFNAATFTDPLFTPVENRRMLNRLRAVDPAYPIQVYHGDYLHFVQSKAKEWGDLCGADHHVCAASDYQGGGASPGDYNVGSGNPSDLAREGATTRLNKFIDHYAKPSANSGEATPSFDVTASLQVCPGNAADLGVPADEPGPTFTAPTFEQLAPNRLNVDMPGTQTTTSSASPNEHALNADPVGNFAAHGGKCPVESSPAGPGTATYLSSALPSQFTMIGATKVSLDYSEVGGDPVTNGFQLNARLYDVAPDGTAQMVDRGVRRVSEPSGTVTYELHGNGWRFEKGHEIRIEIAQDDSPFLKSATLPSSATLTNASLEIPVREGSTSIGGGPELLGGHCKNLQIGSSGKDSLSGTDLSDDIRGGDGNDSLKGFKGSDCLAGENGNDKVRGNGGNDELTGGSGKDKLSGGKGKDSLDGGKGRDVIRPGAGKDKVNAKGGGKDLVVCGKGRDKVKADHRDRLKHCRRGHHH